MSGFRNWVAKAWRWFRWKTDLHRERSDPSEEFTRQDMVERLRDAGTMLWVWLWICPLAFCLILLVYDEDKEILDVIAGAFGLLAWWAFLWLLWRWRDARRKRKAIDRHVDAEGT